MVLYFDMVFNASKDAWQIGAKVHKKCRGALKWKGPNVLDLVSTAIDPYA